MVLRVSCGRGVEGGTFTTCLMRAVSTWPPQASGGAGNYRLSCIVAGLFPWLSSPQFVHSCRGQGRACCGCAVSDALSHAGLVCEQDGPG